MLFSNGIEDYDNLRIGKNSSVGHCAFIFGHIFDGRGIQFGDVALGEGSNLISDRQMWPGGVVRSFNDVPKGSPIRAVFPKKEYKTTGMIPSKPDSSFPIALTSMTT